MRLLNRILFIGMTIGSLSTNFMANAADEGTDSAAQALVKTDPHLEDDEHQSLKGALRRFWGDKIKLVQVS